jgi:hypothetical protein
MDKLFCVFGVHDFGEWECISRSSIFEDSHSTLPIKMIETYKTTCKRCGELCFKKVRI